MGRQFKRIVVFPFGATEFYAGNVTKDEFEKRQKENPKDGFRWRWSKNKFKFGLENDFIVVKNGRNGKRIYTKTYLLASIESTNGKYFIAYKDRTKAISSIDFLGNVYSNDNSKKDIDSIFDRKVFDYSKPVSVLYKLSKISTEKTDIILDFFSGSATTAHACMQLNAEDGGNRKFIMVQLPEVCAPDSEAAKAGYKNICEIGKERIRRAGEKIKTEHATTAPNLDIGFRVLKIDESIMKDVFYSPNETSQDLLSTLESNIKENRTDLDLLFACLVDWSVELSMPLKTESIDGIKIHTMSDGDSPALITCFAQNIPETVVRKIAARHPIRAVFRDSSFTDSPAKINLTEIFKTYSPETDVKVL